MFFPPFMLHSLPVPYFFICLLQDRNNDADAKLSRNATVNDQNKLVTINTTCFVISNFCINARYVYSWGTAVPQWLRRCATNREVAGSIPAGVIGFFIDIKSFRSHYVPGVYSASNRNEYQEHFLRVKEAGA